MGQVKLFIYVICTTVTVKQSLAMKFLFSDSNYAQTIHTKESKVSEMRKENL